MKDFQKVQKAQLKSNLIKVTVPAKVAYDLDSMNKVTERVLGRLGCPACHSGFDIRFDFEKQFHFNEKLELMHEGLRH